MLAQVHNVACTRPLSTDARTQDHRSGIAPIRKSLESFDAAVHWRGRSGIPRTDPCMSAGASHKLFQYSITYCDGMKTHWDMWAHERPLSTIDPGEDKRKSGGKQPTRTPPDLGPRSAYTCKPCARPVVATRPSTISEERRKPRHPATSRLRDRRWAEPTTYRIGSRPGHGIHYV